MFNVRIFVAELIGTFALVFVGAAAGIVGAASNSLGISVLLTALATGFAYSVFVYAYGPISGAHFNPAVTFAMALNNTLKWGQAAFYWLAQFLGGLLAGFLLVATLGSLGGTIEGGATTGVLTNATPGNTQTYIMAVLLEGILTFFLVTTFLRTAMNGRVINPLSGWAIGATLAFAIMAGGAFTGGSLNPARTFGITLPLAINSKNFATLASPFTYVVYFFGPLIGATLAVLLNNFFEDDGDAEIVDAEPLLAEESNEAIGE
jgi:aquaporin Z